MVAFSRFIIVWLEWRCLHWSEVSVSTSCRWYIVKEVFAETLTFQKNGSVGAFWLTCRRGVVSYKFPYTASSFFAWLKSWFRSWLSFVRHFFKPIRCDIWRQLLSDWLIALFWLTARQRPWWRHLRTPLHNTHRYTQIHTDTHTHTYTHTHTHTHMHTKAHIYPCVCVQAYI